MKRPTGADSSDDGGAAEAGEFTQMFRALSGDPTTSSTPVFEAAPSQVAARATPAPAGSDSAAGSESFTRMFQSLAATPTGAAGAAPPAVSPVAPPVVAQPSPAQPATATQVSGEGFTQVFRQITRPPAPPPASGASATLPATAAAPTKAPASGGGEFTQIFSSFQSGAAPVKAASTLAEEAKAPAAQSFAPQSPASAAKPAPAPAPASADKPEQPGEFTQMFRQIAPSDAGPSAGATPQPVQPASQPPAAARTNAAGRQSEPVFSEPTAPGSFTEIFRNPAPPQANRSASSALPQGESFTELFRAPPRTAEPQRQAPSAPFASPAPATPAASSEGSFTQIFRSLGEAPPSSSAAAASQPQGLQLGGSQGPVYPPAAAQPNTAGGDFTRLMQSLASPETPVQPTAQTPSAASFFGEAPRAGGESEFTRVMRGPSLRDAAQKPAPAVASAPVAPGMAIAPAKQAEAPKEEPVKSKQLMMLLIVFNVVLVLALIVLAFFLLRKH